MIAAPQTTSYNRNGIREGWLLLRIPSSRANKLDLPFDQAVGHQSHQREQAEKRRRGPSNRQVPPLSLGFYSQVRPRLLVRLLPFANGALTSSEFAMAYGRGWSKAAPGAQTHPADRGSILNGLGPACFENNTRLPSRCRFRPRAFVRRTNARPRSSSTSF
jgi:hypothetical protein